MPATLQEMGLPNPDPSTPPGNGRPVGAIAGEIPTGAVAGEPASSTAANADNVYVQTHMSTSPKMGNTLFSFMLMLVNSISG